MTVPRRTQSCYLRKRAKEIEVEFREENPENSKDEHKRGGNIDTPECSQQKEKRSDYESMKEERKQEKESAPPHEHPLELAEKVKEE